MRTLTQGNNDTDCQNQYIQEYVQLVCSAKDLWEKNHNFAERYTFNTNYMQLSVHIHTVEQMHNSLVERLAGGGRPSIKEHIIHIISFEKELLRAFLVSFSVNMVKSSSSDDESSQVIIT